MSATRDAVAGDDQSWSTMTKRGKVRPVSVEGAPKHPLQGGWTFWYDSKGRNNKHGDWQRNMVKLGSFNTVEDFWCHYVHLQKPSAMPIDSNYYCFREGLFPAWESFPGGNLWKRRL